MTYPIVGWASLPVRHRRCHVFSTCRREGARWLASILILAALLAFSPPANASGHVSIREDDGWIATAIYPDIDGDSGVEELARDRAADITKSDQHDFIVWAKGDVKANGKPDSQYAYDSTPTISVDRHDLISLVWTNDWDMGGEHPVQNYDVCSVGLVHGKPKVLTLSDLFTAKVDATSIAAQAVIAELQKDPDAIDVQQGKLTAKTPGLVGQFYVGETCLAFILSPSISGRFAINGDTIVKVPYTELTGLDVDGPLAPLLKAAKNH